MTSPSPPPLAPQRRYDAARALEPKLLFEVTHD